MDAREYFQNWVVADYNSFAQCPSDLRLLGNAILSMNASVEYLALDQREYDPDVSGNQRRRDVRKIRDELGLGDLEVCADAFKHVRKGEGITQSSTSVDLNDPAKWKIGERDIAKVAHNSFAILQKEFEKLS